MDGLEIDIDEKARAIDIQKIVDKTESSEKPLMLCVVSGGELVGFIMGMKLPDENFWDKAEGKHNQEHQ
ncbi:MAG: hypothetical protein LBQ51_04540 [Desulfovibrio sp.]|jgi:hypothetical protein|nr:hypothetical protein [Desulfovibrio sp.]